MKILFTLIITLFIFTNSSAQGTPILQTSYNIGKSKVLDSYSADSIPLFVLKGKRKSKKISPNTTLKLAPKGNNILNIIPVEYLKEIHLFEGTAIPRNYRNESVFQVHEIHIIEGKFEEVFKFLKDGGYFN